MVASPFSLIPTQCKKAARVNHWIQSPWELTTNNVFDLLLLLSTTLKHTYRLSPQDLVAVWTFSKVTAYEKQSQTLISTAPSCAQTNWGLPYSINNKKWELNSQLHCGVSQELGEHKLKPPKETPPADGAKIILKELEQLSQASTDGTNGSTAPPPSTKKPSYFF